MDKMKSIILLLLYFWTEGTLTEYQHYYVKSVTSDPCPHDLLCETLDVYVSNESAYFTDNTSFIFLPGTHTLNSTVSIHNVTNVALVGNADLNEGNVTIQCNGSGGLVFQHASRVKLVNLSFVSCGQSLPDSLQRDGETAQAALAFGEISDLLLDSVSVSHSTGYGVLGHCVHGDFEIVYCLFDSNKGNTQHLGGNAAIEYTNCSQTGNGNGTSLVNISSSNFTNGDYEGYNYTEHTYSGTLATGLMMILSQTDITVLITDVLMEGNRNNIASQGFGGNLFLHFFNTTNYISNSVTIERCAFINGTSWLGGGISASFYSNSVHNNYHCTNNLTIQNTNFSQNRGILGIGLYSDIQLNSIHEKCPFNSINIYKCNFDANDLDIDNVKKDEFVYLGNGVAVHIISTFNDNMLVQNVSGHFQVHFEECNFINNRIRRTQNPQKTNITLGVTLAVSNCEVILKTCQFNNNRISALGAYRSKFTFIGNILIQNNTGINGAGLTLCESSYIMLTKSAIISLFNNHALQLGGGIYIEKECFRSKPFCFFQFDNNSCTVNSKTVHLVMINNTAGYAGNHIYGGALDNCYINTCDSKKVYQETFTIDPNQTKHDLSAVTSNPRKVCACKEGYANCKSENIILPNAVFPGEDVKVELVIVGQFEGAVPGTVLVDSQYVHPTTIGKNCTKISFIVKTYGTSHRDIELQIAANFLSSSVGVKQPLIVTVFLKDCPLGFKITNENICDCEEILKQKKCDIASKIISRSPPSWIGYNNRTDGEVSQGMMYHQVCPYDYCLDKEVNITTNDNMFDQDSQCAPNRTGILCSQCKDGFTLSMGTSNCIKCNTKIALPLQIFLFLLLGIFVVVILLVLDVTHTNGEISGLLFYTSTVGLNSSVFLPSRHRNAITLVISWINLRPGTDYCLYDGMNAYGKALLGFSFPVYLFIINAVIIVMCRNSRRLASLVGGNIVKVLATLLLLSYTKLLESVVTVLSFTAMEYPSNTTSSGRVRKLVWLSDPSQEYFSGKHIPLALVAIVFGLLILAYTLVLFFVQPLQRYSHLHCFSWMAKLKPLIDAYTAPNIIKDNCRYWEGLLLLFRSILAVAFAGNVESKIDTNLIAISLSCILLLSIAWSAGGVYKKTHLNILNMLSIANLAVLSMAMSYIYTNKIPYQMDDSHRDTKFIVPYTSFTAAALIAVAIVAKQVYAKIKSCHQKCKRKEYQALDTSDNMPSLRQFPPQAT